MRKTFILLTIMTLLASPVMSQIDLHSHAITQGYLDYIKANGAEMDEGFPIPGWDVEKHIAFMDKAGIQTSVLTMPAPQPFFGDAEASAAVCRKYNEECAALKARFPGRFMFCAALRFFPAQCPAALPFAAARDGEAGHHAACGCRCQPVAALLRPGRRAHR